MRIRDWSSDVCSSDLSHWRPLTAIGHAFSRWQGQHADIDTRSDGFKNVREMVESLGAPPPEAISRAPASARIALPTAGGGDLDRALFARYTGRNYDQHGRAWGRERGCKNG